MHQVTDPVCYHGEGPCWSERWGGLRWLDMLAGDILTLKPDGTIARKHIADVVAAVRPRHDGGAVIGVERGFALEAQDGSVTMLPEIWNDAGVRMNEGGCAPDGSFYCGSMACNQQHGAGKLYRLSPDGNVSVVLERVTISNGLEWSPDNARAYYNDTATMRIDVFDYESGSGLDKRSPFVDLSGEGAWPDGLTVDREGNVWVALANRSEVRCYRPDGRLRERLHVPARKVTACTFGGAALDRLYITTSRENIDVATDPLAGSLFCVEVGPIGMPVREFAG